MEELILSDFTAPRWAIYILGGTMLTLTHYLIRWQMRISKLEVVRDAYADRLEKVMAECEVAKGNSAEFLSVDALLDALVARRSRDEALRKTASGDSQNAGD